jgi:hypothetical protein
MVQVSALWPPFETPPAAAPRGEGFRFRPATRLFAALAAALLAPPAHANDSSAERALGGLTLTRSDAISMDSEDLYVSKERVRVTYKFTNRTDAPVETLVAFPLPDIPPAAETGDVGNFWSDPKDGLKFRTTVDGAPADLQVEQQAMFNGADISSRLKTLGLPLNRYAEDFSTRVNRLPAPERQRLIADKLVADAGEANEKLWDGQWTLKTTITRRQTFPAQRSVTVQHEYAPIVGGSVGGAFDRQWRGSQDFAAKRRKFCIDEDFIASFDRMVAKRKGKLLPYSEIWLGYVLKTGANWAGPIADFRLVIDKGAPGSLVSFCGEGVKKIAPTQFEIRKTNFSPKSDLDVLIVEFPEDG